MEKRVLAAVLLSFVVLYAYQALVPAPKKPAVRKASAPASAQAPGPAAQAADGGATTGAATPAPQPEAEAPAAVPPAAAGASPVVAAATDQEIVVSTKLVRAVFSNRGGVITSWTLEHYTDNAGKHVDLVPEALEASEPRPFALRLPDRSATAIVNSALFKTDAPAQVDATRTPVTLTFDYEDASGLSAHKTFRIEPDSYVITFSIDVRDGGKPINPAVQWGPGLGDTIYSAAHRSFGSYAQPPGAILEADGKVHRLPAAKAASQPTWQGDYPFAGIDDQYFLASLVRPGTVRVQYRPRRRRWRASRGNRAS